MENEFGLLIYLPPLIVLILAITTRRAFESLMVGSVICFIMEYGLQFIPHFVEQAIIDNIAEDAWMYCTLGLFGSFVSILNASHGIEGFADIITRFANTEKKALMSSWFLGLMIFMDDYLNILTVSSVFKSITDKLKSPREMLAYVIDATGAPVCVLVPLSTSAIFFSGVVIKQKEFSGCSSGIAVFIDAIPYNFYGWFGILVVPLVILGVIPKIGPMRRAYERTGASGIPWSEESAKYNRMPERTDDAPEKPGRIVDFLLPLGLLVGLTIGIGDMLVALIVSTVVAMFLYIPRKLMTFRQFSDVFAEGLASMVPILLILVASNAIRTSMEMIYLPQVTIEMVLPYTNATLFPAAAFIVVAGLSFVTASWWGIPALTIPILIPLAAAKGVDPVIAFACVLSGAGFGTHACFYSDTTILSSKATGIEVFEHAFSQFPYVLISAGLAVLGFLVCGVIG